MTDILPERYRKSSTVRRSSTRFDEEAIGISVTGKDEQTLGFDTVFGKTLEKDLGGIVEGKTALAPCRHPLTGVLCIEIFDEYPEGIADHVRYAQRDKKTGRVRASFSAKDLGFLPANHHHVQYHTDWVVEVIRGRKFLIVRGYQMPGKRLRAVS